MRRITFLTILLGFLCWGVPGLLYGQGVPVTTTIVIAPGDSVIPLGHEYLIGNVLITPVPVVEPPVDSISTEARSDSGDLPVSGSQPPSPSPLLDPGDYEIDYRFGLLSLSTRLYERLLLSGDTLRYIVSYAWLPISPPPVVFENELVKVSDSTGSSTVVRSSGGGLTATDIFGKDFQRSGSISRGIVVGSNRDLTVESGLRIQFSGKITDDVEVLGALTDEQTPIQPEGNTQTLREIDNIFFEVRSPVADATLGKFYATGEGGEFTRFTRKLQGVKGLGKFGDVGKTQIVAAVSPGTFRTQEFRGREGDQGPYRLTGETGSRDIIILAGTERVYVDGLEQVRGRENDYVIDYGTGEIFFQARRPITSENEIVVDFEYTDRRYSRTFLAGAHTVHLADSTLRITASIVQEADNQDSPIDFELNDADRILLENAGGNATGAIRSGVSLVGRNDTASGTYRRIDTLINGVSDSIFVYDPASPEAVYSVRFSLAVDGRGDYRSIALGQYEYVGKGAGAYLPVLYLPLPGIQQVGDLAFTAEPSRNVQLIGEVGYSTTNPNRFSIDPAVTRNGVAVKGEARAFGDSVKVAGLSLGHLAANATLRYLDEGFSPVNRIASPEFDRIWNTSARLGNSGYDDLLAEGGVNWRPNRTFELNSGLGRLARGDFFTSFRQEYSVRITPQTFPLVADGSVALINSEDSTGGDLNSDWFKTSNGLAYRIGTLGRGVTPGFRVDYQERDDRRDVVDTLVRGAFRYVQFGPDLLVDFPFMRTTASARYRFDDSARFDPSIGTTRFLDDGAAQTYTLRGELRGVRALNSTIDFTYRRKTYDSVPGVDPFNRLENVSILTRSETRWTPLNRGVEIDGIYGVQTEQAARIQRVYVLVPIGQGGYIWEDLDSNGIQTDDEFRETIAGDGEYVRINLPTEELYPVVNLTANGRLRLDPPKFLSEKSTLGRLLKPVTTETYLRIEEKSVTENESDIYLLNFSQFQNDSTTLNGVALVQQDINLWEKSRDFTLRLRYAGRSGVTRLFNDLERSRSIERSLRAEWNPSVDIGLQFDASIDDRSLLGGALNATRAYDLTALLAQTDFSYRPIRSVELGWVFRVRNADDIYPAVPRSTFLTGNQIRGIYSIETKGRINASIERTVVTGRNVVGGDLFSLPFQLTDGYAIGTTWVGRLSFDYRFGANIQATISYTGRAEPPSNRVVHTGQATVRAFF